MTKNTYLLYVSTGSIPAASTKTKVRKYAKISYVRTKRVMYRVMFSHDIVRFSHHFVNKPDTKPDTKTEKTGQGFCTLVRKFLCVFDFLDESLESHTCMLVRRISHKIAKIIHHIGASVSARVADTIFTAVSSHRIASSCI